MIKIRAKLWTRSYIIVTLINFLIALNFLFLIFMVSEYAMNLLGASPGEAGFAASIFIIGAVIARFITGIQIGRLGYKYMLWLGLLTGFAATLAYFAVNRLMLLYLVRFFHGATFGVATTAAATIVSDLVPDERRGEGIGYFSLSQPLATAVGPFLVIYLSRHGSYAIIFAFAAIVSGIALLMVPFLSIRNLKCGAKKTKAMAGINLANLIEFKVVPVAFICLLVFLCNSSIVSFLKVYAKEIGLVEAAGFFYVVYAAVVLITRPFIGRLFDAKGENVIMYPAIVLMAAGLFLLARSVDGHTLLMAAGLLALGVSSIQTCTQTIVVKMVPRHRLGLANSSYLMFYDIGHGIGPVTAGFLIPFIGYRGIYTVMALISLSCIIFYYFLHGKKAARLAHLPAGAQTGEES